MELEAELARLHEKPAALLFTGQTNSDIKDGKISKDGTLCFTVERERNGQKFVIKYSGKLETKAIKGKIEMTRNGEPVSRDWEAKQCD